MPPWPIHTSPHCRPNPSASHLAPVLSSPRPSSSLAPVSRSYPHPLTHTHAPGTSTSTFLPLSCAKLILSSRSLMRTSTSGTLSPALTGATDASEANAEWAALAAAEMTAAGGCQRGVEVWGVAAHGGEETRMRGSCMEQRAEERLAGWKAGKLGRGAAVGTCRPLHLVHSRVDRARCPPHCLSSRGGQ
jgi:hypothetical protein